MMPATRDASLVPHQTRTRNRWRALACLLILVAVAVRQRPRHLTDDGIAWLASDPVRVLHQVASGWTPTGLGQSQMDLTGLGIPAVVYRVTQVLRVDPWMAQRAWWAVLLCLAWGGAVVLLGRLDVGAVSVRYLVALAYALAPSLLGGLGALSGDLAAGAALPWLLAAALAGRARWAFVTAVLAAALAGAAPAPGACAVVVAGAVVCLLRLVAGPRRRASAAALLGIIVGSAWWAGPAVLQHLTGPESAQDVDPVGGHSLRSVGELVLTLGEGPWHRVAAIGWLLLASAALWGLAVGARRVLVPVALLITGIVLVLAAPALVDAAQLGDVSVAHRAAALYTAAVPGDAAVRLAILALVALALDWGWQRRASEAWVPFGLVLLGVAGILAMMPAVSDYLVDRTLQEPAPAAWSEVATAIRDDGGGRVLVLPGALPDQATWAAPLESPLSLVGLDDVVDIHGVGGQRATAVEGAVERLGAGDGGPAVRALLDGADVRWVVLRRDLEPDPRRPALSLVRSALVQAGLRPVSGYGPEVSAFGLPTGTGTPGEARFVDFGTSLPGPLLELWAVAADGVQGTSDTEPAASLVDAAIVAGGSAAAAASADSGAAANTVAPYDDEAQRSATVSDAERDRPRVSSLAIPNHGATVTTPGSLAALSTATATGVRSVAASSTAATPKADVPTRPADQPVAALDGNAFSAWRSTAGDTVGAWWAVQLDEPSLTGEVRIDWIDDPFVGPAVRTVLVTTDDGRRVVDVPPGGGVTIALTAPTSSLRLEVLVVGRGEGGVGISEVTQITGQRVLRLPAGVTRGPVVLATSPASSRPCVTDSAGMVACSPVLLRAGEDLGGIDRTFEAEGRYRIVATAVATPGAALDALLRAAAPASAPVVVVSSSLVSDPRGDGLAAVDGDAGTTWTAGLDDEAPTLTLTWSAAQSIHTLRLSVGEAAAVSVPTRVRVGWDAGTFTTLVGDHGAVDLPGVLITRSLTVQILASNKQQGVDSLTAGVRDLPPGVTELIVDGAAVRPVESGRWVSLPCGAGPTVVVDGRTIRTGVQATYGDLVVGSPVAITACSSVDLGAEGDHHLRFTDDYAWSPRTLTLAPEGVGSPSERPPVRAIPFASSDGWRLGTGEGRPVVVDGWRQGWLAGSTTPASVVWWPTDVLRVCLVVGWAAVLWVLLAAVTGAVVSRRRLSQRQAGVAPPPEGAG